MDSRFFRYFVTIMKRRLALILFTAAVAFVSPLRGQNISEITLQHGEKWWGIFAGNSPAQPFSEPFHAHTGLPDRGGFCTGSLVSSAGRYIQSDAPAGVVFDGKKFTITSDGPEVSAEKGGRTLRQAYLAMHHSDFKGTDKFPSSELFTRPVYGIDAGDGFVCTSEDAVAYAETLLKEGFTPGIIVLGEGWRRASGYGFDERWFPDPAAFIARMHTLGFKVMLTVTPYVAAWGRDFHTLAAHDLLVSESPGKPLVMSGPEGFFAALDLTAPAQADELKKTLAELQRTCGVDGFRFDCGALIERIVDDTDYAKKYLAAMPGIGADFALAEFRPGMPRFQSVCAAAVRTSASGEAGYLQDVITAGLAAGPFTQVVPGFEALAVADEKTAVRYALMQAMMPVADIPFEPWKYGFAAAEMKRVLTFRAGLAKYMEKAYTEACKTVEPIIRPMEYIFAGDGFADCADQYMLGDRYLVAPAVDDNAKRLVRLPKGTWRDMNGKKHKGPLVLEAETDGYKMVWFELQ